MEVKYIITKDGKHFKSEWLHHSTIARDNGYSEKDIVECGLFLDKQLFILECSNAKHVLKHKDRYVGNALNIYQDKRLTSWLKGRELDSKLTYCKEIGLRGGD
jgi:hypothetical protein